MTTTASRRELFDEKLANCKLYFPDCMCVGVAIHRATEAHNLGVLHTFSGANGLSPLVPTTRSVHWPDVS